MHDLVPSDRPQVAFDNFAAACVPVLADTCEVVVRTRLTPGEPQPVESAPPVPGARPLGCGARARAGTGSSLCAFVETTAEAGRPGFYAAVAFGWLDLRSVDDVDQVVADLLVRQVADQVNRERIRLALDRARSEADNLSRALDSNRRIGQAMGVLMASCKLTPAQAFDLLRRASQHTHRKLCDIADEVRLTGTLELTERSVKEARS